MLNNSGTRIEHQGIPSIPEGVGKFECISNEKFGIVLKYVLSN